MQSMRLGRGSEIERNLIKLYREAFDHVCIYVLLCKGKDIAKGSVYVCVCVCVCVCVYKGLSIKAKLQEIKRY